MSGSGSGWYRDYKTDTNRLQDAISQTDQAKYEADVEKLVKDILREYNDRDVEAIRKHLETIEGVLSNEIEGFVELVFGGSTEKHTYVNGLSDIDMLVRLNDTSLAEKTPGEVLIHFTSMLQKRLPYTELKVGDLAVTVKFSDGHEIQLLPAIQTASGVRIAQSDGKAWSNVVSPQRFAKKLTEVNQQQDRKVVPVIKLIKAMNEKMPKQSRLSGYHIESMAIEVFENYSGRKTYREMVRQFWNEAQKRVLQPIKDSTGQSVHVDDYLDSPGGIARQRTSAAISKIYREIENAESQRSSETWEAMLTP